MKRTTFTAHSHKNATAQSPTFILNKQERLEAKTASAGSLQMILDSVFCTSGATSIASELSCW